MPQDQASKTLYSLNNDPLESCSSLPEGLTLEVVLSNQAPSPFSLEDFSDYLKSIYCCENLLFYQATIKYRALCSLYFGDTSFGFSDTSAQLLSKNDQSHFRILKEEFDFILKEYVFNDAPQEINIPFEIRHQLLHLYQTQKLYHPDLLSPASQAVVELLRVNAFIPFATDPLRMKSKKSMFTRRKKSVPSLRLNEVSPSLSESTSLLSPGFLKKITSSFKMKTLSLAPDSPLPSPAPRRASSSAWNPFSSEPSAMPSLSSFSPMVTPSFIQKDHLPPLPQNTLPVQK
ncbi:hypothetical protein BD560DRAFT_392775 [Blakeslea trispora]|nr:hypothetical protein BD560DRAFT_392775 [Blakeslea trispora]